MANYGVKIMETGKSSSSTNIDDHVFWSKYPSLILLEKQTIPIEITSVNGIPEGSTEVYAHGYNFVPLVLAVISDDTDGNKFFLPIDNLSLTGLNCDEDHILKSNFYYDIDSTNVTIHYTVYCAGAYMGVEDTSVSGTGTVNVDLYFFMWKLGSSWS